MEKLAKGKTGYYWRYNTDTAEQCGTSEEGTLYRKITGEYFVVKDDEVQTMSYDEAAKWTKAHMPEEVYQRYFETTEADRKTRKALCVELPVSTIKRLRRERERSGKTIVEIMTELIETNLP